MKDVREVKDSILDGLDSISEARSIIDELENNLDKAITDGGKITLTIFQKDGKNFSVNIKAPLGKQIVLYLVESFNNTILEIHSELNKILNNYFEETTKIY